jgi:hypothetical protein
MLGQQFYHETMRKVVVAFGTIFNNINIVRTNSSGAVTQSMKVPLAYGPKQKFLTRLREDPNLNKKVALTLPRMGFEISGISYDPSRKLNSIQKDFNDRRVLTYALSFTAKFYLYGPVTDQKVIKQVQVDQYTDMPINAPKREQRYNVTPSPITADADDNFGFNETTSFFEDAKNFDPVSGTDKEDA